MHAKTQKQDKGTMLITMISERKNQSHSASTNLCPSDCINHNSEYKGAHRKGVRTLENRFCPLEKQKAFRSC